MMRSLKYLPCVLALSALAVLHPLHAWAKDNVLEIQHQGNISYVSGGVGSEESEALQAVQHHYNFRIMSSSKTGHYSSEIHILVSDLQHNTIIDAIGGPIFYANLPKGRYIVESSNEGQRKKQTVTITDNKPARIHFIWQEDAADSTNS